MLALLLARAMARSRRGMAMEDPNPQHLSSFLSCAYAISLYGQIRRRELAVAVATTHQQPAEVEVHK